MAHGSPIPNAEPILEPLRRAELELVGEWIRPGMKVLEIGGANGLQASILAERGCHVVSVDLPSETPPARHHFPVQQYDGRTLPFPAASFDCVYSSNVLEHVPRLDPLLSETRRVLKPGGLAVHVLPSSAWRWWTSVTHYPCTVRRAVRRLHSPRATGSGTGVSVVVRRSLVARLLLPGPHGEYPSALSELYYFSRRRWDRVFREAGFDIQASRPTGIFYTGNTLLPGLPFSVRRWLAGWLGSACHIFVLRAGDYRQM